MYMVKVRKKKPQKIRIYGNNRNEARTAQSSSISPPGRVLFKDVLSLWVESNCICRKRSTNQKYNFLIEKHILPTFGEFFVDQLNAPMINRFLMEKLEKGRLDHKGGLSPSYVRTLSIIISATLDFAAKEGICAPLRSAINKPTIIKRELPILSFDAQRIIEQKATQQTDSTKLAVLLSLYAGLRIGEICALSWNDVDLSERILHVRHTVSRESIEGDAGNKTRMFIDTPKTVSSARTIPISSSLYQVLEPAKRCARSAFVISSTGSFVNPRTLEHRFHKFLDCCGVKSINFHALRHTFATRCIEVGVDIKSLSEMLGHSSVTITLETYVHSSIQLKRSQIEKITYNTIKES